MGRESSNTENENGLQLQIPEELKKTVRSIREIVNKNCTDSEIYVALRDCAMDPNEAVQKLLSQDIFHEVKSKRERRKEMKETQESKSRGSNNGYRGVKVGDLSVGRMTFQISHNDHGKAAYMRGNLSVAPSATSSSLTYPLRLMNEQSSPYSDFFNVKNSKQTVGTSGTISSSEQISGGPQAALVRCPSGQVSMADIVKMGRPCTRDSHTTAETSYALQDVGAQESLHCCLKPSHDSLPSLQEMHQELQCPHPANGSKTIHHSGTTAILNISTASGIGMLPNKCHMFDDRTNLPKNCQSEEVQVSERNIASESLGLNCVESDSPSSRQENTNHVGGACHCKDGSFEDVISLNLHIRGNELQEGRESGSHLSVANASTTLNDKVAVSLQQMSLVKGDNQVVSPSNDNCTVVFPNDMQALASDCSHLSFGTYKSGMHAKIPGPLESNVLRGNLESKEVSVVLNGSSSACLETRNSGCLGESIFSEQVGPSNTMNRLTANSMIHNLPVSLQPELIEQTIYEVNSRHAYVSPKSVPNSCFKNIQEPSSALSVVISPDARNLPHFHRELEASSMPIPVDLLASGVQSARNSDLAHSSLTGTQPLTSRCNDASSAGSSTIPVKEILNSGALFLPKSHLSTMAGASLAAGHILPQHLLARYCSQSSPSPEELIKWNSYTSARQTYSHTPSALQQSYQDSSIFHDPLAGKMYNIQQWKGVSSRSNLPVSDANISSYGGLGNRSNFTGRFLNDLSTTATGSAVGYDDLLHAQYKEGNNFTMLHQNGYPPSRDWNASGSKRLSTVPDDGYYNLGQPLSSYQGGQLFSQNYGASGYTNAFHSQQRISPEEQWQSLGDLAFCSSQGPSDHLHQLRQHIH